MPLVALAILAAQLLVLIVVGALALSGKLDDPASPYRRALIFVASVTLGLGVVVLGSFVWSIWFA